MRPSPIRTSRRSKISRGELNVERNWNDGRVRLTLFKEHDQQRDHLANEPRDQSRHGRPVPTTTIGNVDAIRMQGVELSAEKNNVLINGLQLFGSVTYVDSRILSRSDLGRHESADGQPTPWSASAFPTCRTGGPSSA